MPTEKVVYEYRESSPLRIDRFLLSFHPNISRNYLQGILARGFVRVNGAVVRKGTILRHGDRIEVESFVLPEERQIQPNRERSLTIVYEDESIAVINKPAGLPTHPNDFEDVETVANLWIHHCPQAVSVGDDPLRPGIVHRLDADTSGLLILAKTQDAFTVLREQFNCREVGKKYVALVVGDIQANGAINAPIAHHPKSPRKMIAVTDKVRPRGLKRVREARTEYQVVRRCRGFTLLEVQTRTGRMHQVRVHLSSIGHPLVGDRLYQSAKERIQDTSGASRHFLHAAELRFRLPSDGRTQTFFCELPDDLSSILKGIESFS